MSGVEIAGFGHYAPARRVPNAEIEARLGLADGWIKRRTGIEARRYAADDEALSDLAVRAGDNALNAAGITRRDVALVLLATSTPDHLLPPSAPLVAHRLGLDFAGGIDLAGACGGFVYALTLADAYVRAHQAPVLIIAANILSRRINIQDRASSVLFADAAGATLLVPSARSNAGVAGADLAADGGKYGLIQIPGGGSRKPFAKLAGAEETLMVISNGQTVYAAAVDMMSATAEAALAKANASAGDVAAFIPHQANARMMASVARRLAIAPDKVRSTISEFANSSAATIPFTLSATAPASGYCPGDMLLMTAAGAGLTGGAVAWRW